MLNDSLSFFSESLSSSAPTPGGGGASALAGALAAALASMVCNLTTGKKKYAEFESDIQRIMADAETYRKELLLLIDSDAKAFEPLSKAYSIPKDDPQRGEIMENALRTACEPPRQMMKLCAKVIELLAELSDKGSTLAISDVGVGAALARAALMGASLNIFINAKSMADRDYAAKLTYEADALLEEYSTFGDSIFYKVKSKLS